MTLVEPGVWNVWVPFKFDDVITFRLSLCFGFTRNTHIGNPCMSATVSMALNSDTGLSQHET